MTSKSAGQVAYEARFPHAGGRGEKPWKEQSRDVHELWDRVAEAVRLKVTEPVPGWRESGAEDPHGTRYLCRQDALAGGHLTDDQVAFAVAMADRGDRGLEGVLAIAKDRIRWLSRRLHQVEEQLRHTREEGGKLYCRVESLEIGLRARNDQLEATVRDANGMREELGLRASRITMLEADLQALEQRKPIGLPPGALQAYSDAYKDARNGPNHLACHIAGLRACIVHAGTMMVPGAPAATAPQETLHPMPAGGPQYFLTEAKRICGTDRVSGLYASLGWEELSEEAQMWVAAIVQRTTEDVSLETVDILRRAAPLVDWCCGEGHCPLWDGAYVDPIAVHDTMAKMLGVEALYDLQKNPDAPAPATPYEIIGTTYDGVQVLKPHSPPDHFTPQEIRDVMSSHVGMK